MKSLKLLWLPALITPFDQCAAREAEGPRPADEDDCDCFLINGSNPTYYAKHMFFDFRSLAEFAGAPDVLKDPKDAALASPSSDYFDSDDWTSVWELQTWDNEVGHDDELSEGAPILMVNSPNNVFLERSDEDDDNAPDTFMTLRTKRLPKFQTAAEFESTNDYLYVSLRVLARTIGAPGAVTAIFTYRDSEELADVQEADIEFLTGGSRRIIHYTNQPSYSLEGDNFPEATRSAAVPGGGDWTEWMVHRLDWTPDGCVWYVDGVETASISYQTPRDPSQIIFNAWSNGGYWSGNMSTYDEAYLQVQWIEMVFNKTGGEDEGSCARVCSIDETDEAGAIAMLWNSPASRLVLDGWLNGGWFGLWAVTLALSHWAL
ncbi:hypothetical protein ACO1O0_001407 [Amphichorda felina]